ncbi:hypothetical protein Tco_0491167 [Tanacetum coccineum]
MSQLYTPPPSSPSVATAEAPTTTEILTMIPTTTQTLLPNLLLTFLSLPATTYYIAETYPMLPSLSEFFDVAKIYTSATYLHQKLL